MARQFINPPDLATPPNNIYNHVVKVGNTVYIAGQVSRDLDDKTAYVGDVEGQVRQVWGNLEKGVRNCHEITRPLLHAQLYLMGDS